MEVIATGSDGKICMMAVPENEDRGRIIIDCGFTKLMKQFWDKAAGNERYVVNSAVWLLSLD